MRAKTLTIGLWGIVLAIGLASVLTRSALSGDTAALAKSLVLRIVGGELGEARPEEVAALLKFGTVLVFEPLVFIGALLLLEFRFAPAANAKDYRLAWILQTLVLT